MLACPPKQAVYGVFMAAEMLVPAIILVAAPFVVLLSALLGFGIKSLFFDRKRRG
jgi:hypothetical protein